MNIAMTSPNEIFEQIERALLPNHPIPLTRRDFKDMDNALNSIKLKVLTLDYTLPTDDDVARALFLQSKLKKVSIACNQDTIEKIF